MEGSIQFTCRIGDRYTKIAEQERKEGNMATDEILDRPEIEGKELSLEGIDTLALEFDAHIDTIPPAQAFWLEECHTAFLEDSEVKEDGNLAWCLYLENLLEKEVTPYGEKLSEEVSIIYRLEVARLRGSKIERVAADFPGTPVCDTYDGINMYADDQYREYGIQPYDIMKDKGIIPDYNLFENYLFGSALKYLIRHPDKDGVKDLRKCAGVCLQLANQIEGREGEQNKSDEV